MFGFNISGDYSGGFIIANCTGKKCTAPCLQGVSIMEMTHNNIYPMRTNPVLTPSNVRLYFFWKFLSSPLSRNLVFIASQMWHFSVSKSEIFVFLSEIVSDPRARVADNVPKRNGNDAKRDGDSWYKNTARCRVFVGLPRAQRAVRSLSVFKYRVAGTWGSLWRGLGLMLTRFPMFVLVVE